jgi:acetyl-CoA carboxylase carboxyl transferase subunit alpha
MLSRWQVVQLSRHPQRPTPLDYLERLFPDFVELHGDRAFGEDPAIVGGPALFEGRSVMVVAHARGRTPAEQEARRQGMPRPEGFRKAARLARLADRLGLPVVTLVDTPGAYPGADAEARGQAMAIADSIEAFATCRSPVVACVVGEGGSGGALALATADVILALEYSFFVVISPEACSSILFRDGSHAAVSAEALRPTARDLVQQGLVDELVAEPAGGAHLDPVAAVESLRASLARTLDGLVAQPVAARLERRYARLRSHGAPAYAP